MTYIMFLFGLLFIRLFAGYDSRYQRFQKGKYLVIKNLVLKKVLLEKIAWDKSNRRKSDLNKMRISALVLYIFCLVVVLVNIVFMFFIPKIPINPWGFETGRIAVYADTLNEKISAISIWLLFMTILEYIAVSMVMYLKATDSIWQKVLTGIAASVIFIPAVVLSFEMAAELIVSLI